MSQSSRVITSFYKTLNKHSSSKISTNKISSPSIVTMASVSSSPAMTHTVSTVTQGLRVPTTIENSELSPAVQWLLSRHKELPSLTSHIPSEVYRQQQWEPHHYRHLHQLRVSHRHTVHTTSSLLPLQDQVLRIHPYRRHTRPWLYLHTVQTPDHIIQFRLQVHSVHYGTKLITSHPLTDSTLSRSESYIHLQRFQDQVLRIHPYRLYTRPGLYLHTVQTPHHIIQFRLQVHSVQ